MSRLYIILLMLVMLAGCSGGSDPAQVIEKYLQARLTSNVDELRSLSCTAWESQVVLEANSFKGRDAKLQDMSCKADSTSSDSTVVRCQGKITVTYQGENRDVPLGNYQVVQEDGEWKMCGEAN